MGDRSRAFFNIIWLIGSGGGGLAALAIAAAAFTKAQTVVIIRNGFRNDYMHLAEMMGVIGAALILIAIVSLYFNLRRRPSPPPPASHF